MRILRWAPLLTAACLLAACTAAPQATIAVSSPSPTPTISTDEEPQLAAAEDVLAALSWREASEFPAQVLSGWSFGFREHDYCLTGPYRWLDSEHLLVLPVVAQPQYPDGTYSQWAHPMVVSTASHHVWPLAEAQQYCLLPVWSAALQRVIEIAGDVVQLRDVDGNITASFAGRAPLSLAPSGLRLLAGDAWIDLETGASVPLSDAWMAVIHSKPAWSADEQRIFGCCFQYADVQTGDAWQQDSFDGFFVVGRGSGPGEELYSRASWAPGERQAFIEEVALWFLQLPESKQAIPIFDPAEQNYISLIDELDIDLPPYCSALSSAGAAYLWIRCFTQERNEISAHTEAYVVALPSLAVTAVAGQPELLAWSANEAYAVYTRNAGVAAAEVWLLNAASGENTRLLLQPSKSVAWHPSQPSGVLYTTRKAVLGVFNQDTGASRQIQLDFAVEHVAWQPEGSAVAFIAADGSLWWLADALDPATMPQQLTPPLPDVHTLRWSPDGRRLAFVSGNELHVLTLIEGEVQP
ncbi:MAG: PD40 domain-containing protein [Anaerolineales bacterium]|nr:MAG: PD40 domain-containing protein [Anaerolineales bacterium]